MRRRLIRCSPGPRALLGLAILAALLLTMALPTARAGEDLVAGTYDQLDTLRDRKLHQLRQYLDRVLGLARAAACDDALTGFFAVKRRYLALQEHAPPPPDARAAMAAAERQLQEHYLANYLAFHDILFVDRGGLVFHSIRGEADAGQNLFEPPLRDTALVRRLRADPDAGFVDYEYYAASDEPSAFFVEPVHVAGRRAGWLILQSTIDKINRIFDRTEQAGRTSEVFLVSRERLMLTDSRFRAGTSILEQHLSDANIDAKFAERRGHKIVTDYRGERALTSFQVVPVLSTEWLLIAKIDEDEVVTRAWRDRDLGPALLAAVAASKPAPVAAPAAPESQTRVDMDEFRRTEPGKQLVTYGVSTCTAVVVGRPGHFAYLGHASPYDRIYGDGDVDLVGHMLKRVQRFEVYPSELRELAAVIVAPHLDSAHGAIDRLLAAGLYLDQIAIVHDPNARRADVWHDPATGQTHVRWMAADRTTRWVRASDTPSLGALAKTILGYPEAVRQADTARADPPLRKPVGASDADRTGSAPRPEAAAPRH